MHKTSRLALLLFVLLFGCATPPAPQASSALTERKPDAEASPETPAAKSDDSDNVYFTFGATAVDPKGQEKLRAHALRLQEDPKLVVTLIGQTDNMGSRAYNVAITEKRIESVRALLRSYGVGKKQIRRYAVGSERLDKGCQTSACRQKMRCVELSYPKK